MRTLEEADSQVMWVSLWGGLAVVSSLLLGASFCSPMHHLHPPTPCFKMLLFLSPEIESKMWIWWNWSCTKPLKHHAWWVVGTCDTKWKRIATSQLSLEKRPGISRGLRQVERGNRNQFLQAVLQGVLLQFSWTNVCSAPAWCQVFCQPLTWFWMGNEIFR